MQQSTLEHSQWQGKVVPTVRVALSKSAKVQDAIDRAAPFTRIVVGAGTYTEQLAISKPLELVAEEGEEPIFHCRTPCLTIYGDIDCHVSDIVFKSKASATSASKDPPAVLVSGGRPVLKRIEATSLQLSGSSQAHVSESTINGNAHGHGLAIKDTAGGVINNCRVYGHGGYCVYVATRGKPEFNENEFTSTLHDAKLPPGRGVVMVTGPDCSPVFKNNRINDSLRNAPEGSPLRAPAQKFYTPAELEKKRAIITVEAYAAPMFDHNSIQGGVVGLALRTCGGSFVDNHITDGVACGVFIASRATAQLVQNQIQVHACMGMCVHDAEPKVAGNMITNNKFYGICVSSTAATFKLSRCHFERNGIAIYAREGSYGTAEANEVRGSTTAAIQCRGAGSHMTFKSNTIVSNGDWGVISEMSSSPRFFGNAIFGHRVGVQVTTASSPVFEDNTIGTNADSALAVFENGRGTFKRNKLTHGVKGVVNISDGGNPTLSENVVSDAGGPCAILIHEGGIGLLTKNNVSNVPIGIAIRLFADPVIDGNTVAFCGEHGILVEEEGIGTITNNTVDNCSTGITAMRGGEPTIRANHVKGASKRGISLGEGNRATVERNHVHRCVEGITIHGADSDAIVRRNKCEENRLGIVSRDLGFAFVEGNTTINNREGGYGTVEKGGAHFYMNTSVQDAGPGLFSTDTGAGTFSHCRSKNGMSVGGRIASGANPELKECDFTGTSGAGLDVCKGAGGAVIDCSASYNSVGIRFTGLSTTTVTNFVAESNVDCGGYLAELAQAELRGCTFRSQPVGLSAGSASECIVEECLFERNVVGFESKLGGAPVRIQKCTFRDSGEAHIDFHSNGEATVADCALADGQVAIRSRDRGKGRVANCSITDFAEAGILFESSGATHVADSVVTACAIGVLSRTASDGDVHRCKIESNRCNVRTETRGNVCLRECTINNATLSYGCWFEGGGKLSKCEIAHNSQGGVFIGPQGKPRITESKIFGNAQAGIVSGDKSEGLVQSNTIDDNPSHGIVLRQGCATHFIQNTVQANQGFGLLADRASGGLILENTFRRNRTANMRLMTMSNNRFEKNKICDATMGIMVEGSSATLKENTITGHTDIGVLVSGKSICVLEGNEISHNHVGVDFTTIRLEPVKSGLRSRRGSTVGQSPQRGAPQAAPVSPTTAPLVASVEDATNTDSPAAGGDIAAGGGGGDASHLQVGGPRSRSVSPAIDRHQSSMTNGPHNGSSAVLRSNTLRHNVRAGVRFGPRCIAKVLRNVFNDEHVGLEVQDDAAGTVEDNCFKGNETGLDITGENIRTAIARNLFEGNRLAGMRLRQNPGLTISDNLFKSNQRVGMLLTEHFAGKVVKNEFTDDAVAVSVDGHSKGSVVENLFEGCNIGVQVMPSGDPVIAKNLFYGGHTGVLSMDSRGLVEHCIFRGLIIGGVCAEGSSSHIAVSRCLFADSKAYNTSAGVVMRNAAEMTVDECDFHGNSIGVKAEDHGAGAVQTSIFHDNGHGAHASDGGCPALTGCVFARNDRGDVCSTMEGAPTVKKCYFKGESAFALTILDTGGCDFSENVIRNMETAGVSLIGAKAAMVTRNLILRCPVGVVAQGTPSTTSVVSDNVIAENTTGVSFRDGGGVVVELNSIKDNDLAVLMKGAAETALLERNHIVRSGRGAIAITDTAARATLRYNFIDTAGQFGITVTGDETAVSVLENVVINCRTNISLNSGNALVSQNQSSQGDTGLLIQAEFFGECDSNVVHSNKRTGCFCMSPRVRLSRNCFYSQQEGGALEFECQTSSRQLHGNDVKNQFTPHWAKPDVPVKVNLGSVKEGTAAFLEKEVVEKLRSLFKPPQGGGVGAELPDCPERHCRFISSEGQGLTANEMAQKRLTRRQQLQEHIPTVDGVGRRVGVQASTAAAASTTPAGDDSSPSAATGKPPTHPSSDLTKSASEKIATSSVTPKTVKQAKARVNTFNKVRRAVHAKHAFETAATGGGGSEPTSDSGGDSRPDSSKRPPRAPHEKDRPRRMSDSSAPSGDSFTSPPALRRLSTSNAEEEDPAPTSPRSKQRPVGPPSLRTSRRARQGDESVQSAVGPANVRYDDANEAAASGVHTTMYGISYGAGPSEAVRNTSFSTVNLGFDGQSDQRHQQDPTTPPHGPAPAAGAGAPALASIGVSNSGFTQFGFDGLHQANAAGSLRGSNVAQAARAQQPYGARGGERPMTGNETAEMATFYDETRVRDAVYHEVNYGAHTARSIKAGPLDVRGLTTSSSDFGSPNAGQRPRPPVSPPEERVRNAFGQVASPSSHGQPSGPTSGPDTPLVRPLQPTAPQASQQQQQTRRATVQPPRVLADPILLLSSSIVAGSGPTSPRSGFTSPRAGPTAAAGGVNRRFSTALPPLAVQRFDGGTEIAAPSPRDSLAGRGRRPAPPVSFQLRTRKLVEQRAAKVFEEHQGRAAPWRTPQAGELKPMPPPPPPSPPAAANPPATTLPDAPSDPTVTAAEPKPEPAPRGKSVSPARTPARGTSTSPSAARVSPARDAEDTAARGATEEDENSPDTGLKRGRVVEVEWRPKHASGGVVSSGDEQHRKRVMAQHGTANALEDARLFKVMQTALGGEDRTFGGWQSSRRTTPGLSAQYPASHRSAASSEQPSLTPGATSLPQLTPSLHADVDVGANLHDDEPAPDRDVGPPATGACTPPPVAAVTTTTDRAEGTQGPAPATEEEEKAVAAGATDETKPEEAEVVPEMRDPDIERVAEEDGAPRGRSSGWLLDHPTTTATTDADAPHHSSDDHQVGMNDSPAVAPMQRVSVTPRAPPPPALPASAGVTVDLAQTAARLSRMNRHGKSMQVFTNQSIMSPPRREAFTAGHANAAAAGSSTVAEQQLQDEDAPHPNTAEGVAPHKFRAPLGRPKHGMAEVVVLTPVGSLHQRGSTMSFRPKHTASGHAASRRF